MVSPHLIKESNKIKYTNTHKHIHTNHLNHVTSNIFSTRIRCKLCFKRTKKDVGMWKKR